MRKMSVFLVMFLMLPLLSCGSAEERGTDPVERSSYSSSSQSKRPSSSSMKGKCRKGDNESCYKYGLRYYLGKKVRKDYKKAGRFFYKACQGDYIRACYALGVMYKNGRGTAKNCTNADKYFELACDNGHQKACDKMWSCKKEPERDSYDEYDDYGDGDDYDDETGYVDEDDWDEGDDSWDDF